MKYLNVQLSGLDNRTHPTLNNILNTQDVRKLRTHIKFLTCDIMFNQVLPSNQPSLSPACHLCTSPDSVEHILVSCRALSEVRDRLHPELMNTVVQVQPTNEILRTAHCTPPDIFAQFILDCTSPNLPDSFRIPAHNPEVSEVFRISRDWCYAMKSERSRQLKSLT